MSYFVFALSVCYLNVIFSRSITSIFEEREREIAGYSCFCISCSTEFLTLGAWERLRYFIVTLPGPFIPEDQWSCKRSPDILSK